VEELDEGALVWVIVGRDPHANLWEGVSVEVAPVAPTPTLRALRATWTGRRAELVGAGRLYLPEEECLEADRLLREQPTSGEVNLAVDEHGNVSPLRLWIQGRKFEN
jgi:hypothetical protein